MFLAPFPLLCIFHSVLVMLEHFLFVSKFDNRNQISTAKLPEQGNRY